MPGFITHYLFGCEVVKDIKDKDMKKLLKDNKGAFSLGLQGPDIFFYFPYSFTGNKKRLASVMHVYDTGDFFINLIKETNRLEGKAKEIGIAYVLGFLGHYSLDTKCHPYIYYRTGYLNKGKDYFGKHTDFETDIDCLLMKKLMNYDVVNFRQEKTIKLDKNSIVIIARLLNRACKITYPYIKSSVEIMKLAVESFYYTNGLLNDRRGYKKRILSSVEKTIFGNVSAAPLFIVENKEINWEDPLNDNHKEWKNPWNMKEKSRESFMDLILNAKGYYINLMEDVFSEITNIEDVDYNKLSEVIGNNSYHSGLDCSITS